ncbi:MAG: CotH kinase family protein [Bacteroidales bacterium]|nr:CotH kinase family protein [Bacteroidales bacterium]
MKLEIQNYLFTARFRIFLSVLFLIFCSKVLISQTIDHWEMVVAAEDTWHYFPGNAEPPASWTDLDFDDSAWASGPGGIGYGDGDDQTVISQVASVYLRIKFNIVDAENISSAILHMDYDDAFVAYLNGHEIGRSNIGTVGIRPAYSSFAKDNHEAHMYSGGLPEQFVVSNDLRLYYLKSAENVLAIQVHNINAASSDLSALAYLLLGIKNDSRLYRAVPDWFEAPTDDLSNLPLFVIETNGQSIVDEPKITSHLKVIDNGPGKLNSIHDKANYYDGWIGIEIRGQSSQMFPKKSFSMELRDETGEGIDVGLLGLPAEEDWVLYAPYSDKTMLRNAITYQLGGKMGNWQPRFKFCELYINGQYLGVYLLIEKIKRDSNRLDINKLKPDEIKGDDLSGGYIVKVDKIGDLMSDEYFYTHPINRYFDARNYAFTYVYPDFDDIVAEQKTYIDTYLTDFENALNGNTFKDPENGYAKYIDVNSFIDFQIINELSNNVDGYRYSTYFYKLKDSNGGKLFAGPLWDFNLGYGNVDYSPLNLATDRWLYPNYGPNEGYPMHWWARLMEDPIYREALYQRWTELRAGSFTTDSIIQDLDTHIAHLGASITRNFEKWPIIGQYIWPNYSYANSSYEQEVDYLKTWMINRLNWMDANITSTTGFAGLDKSKGFTVYPNPATNCLYLSSDLAIKSAEIYSITGQKVKTMELPSNKLNITDLVPGVFFIAIEHTSGERFISKFIKY